MSAKTNKIEEKNSLREATPPVSTPAPKEAEEPKVTKVKVEPLIAFVKWFRARSKDRGFKPHWVEGMRAFTDVTQRRTMSQWDEIFRNY